MLLIVLFLLLAAGSGALAGVLKVSVWMLVPFVFAMVVVGSLARTSRGRVRGR